MEALLQHKQIDPMMILLNTMGHDCRRLVGSIKQTSKALEAGVELQLKAKNSSISNLQKRCADLQTKNKELEDSLLMMPAKVAEMEEAAGARRGEKGGEQGNEEPKPAEEQPRARGPLAPRQQGKDADGNRSACDGPRWPPARMGVMGSEVAGPEAFTKVSDQ